MKATGWLKGLKVTADGTGVVLHAGTALLRGTGGQHGADRGLGRGALAIRRLERRESWQRHAASRLRHEEDAHNWLIRA